MAIKLRVFGKNKRVNRMVCSVQCLIQEAGYVYLDVRSELANDMIGKVPGSVNIPIVKAKRRFDSELKDNVVETEDLPDFIERVGFTTASLIVGFASQECVGVDMRFMDYSLSKTKPES